MRSIAATEGVRYATRFRVACLVFLLLLLSIHVFWIGTYSWPPICVGTEHWEDDEPELFSATCIWKGFCANRGVCYVGDFHQPHAGTTKELGEAWPRQVLTPQDTMRTKPVCVEDWCIEDHGTYGFGLHVDLWVPAVAVDVIALLFFLLTWHFIWKKRGAGRGFEIRLKNPAAPRPPIP